MLALGLAACSGSAGLDAPDAGRTVTYEPGVPNFDMESIVRLEEDDSAVVDVYLSIPMLSLIFLKRDDRFVATYEGAIRLVSRDVGGAVVEEALAESLAVSTYDSTLSHHAHRTRTTLRPPPGEYVVEASITDLESGSTVQRRQAISIQPSTSTELFLGRPLLEARTDEGNFEPVVRLHMPARSDSLRASVHLFNLDSTTPAEVVMRLLSFRSDTTVASPPFWISPTRASLQYRGVDYGTTDTVQVSRRRLEPVDRTAMVQFELPRLSPGIYRLELEARSGQDEVQRRHRVLSVKNASFPSMSALDDLIDALTYIAFDDEIEYILDARDPMERKRRFDAFWGSLVTNRNLAANLIRLYYERIEEANLFFTAYKEGWKTDRGMIYTILGPPIYIDKRVDVEIWHYSYGDRDPANTFVFERAIRHGNDPFENYILQRRPYYQYEWSRAVDRWREGEVL